MEARLFVSDVRAYQGRMTPAIILLLAFTKSIMQIQRDYASLHVLSKLVLGKKELEGKLYPNELLTLLFEKNRDDKGRELWKVSRAALRMKELNSFDPRIESQRQIHSDKITHFFRKLQLMKMLYFSSLLKPSVPKLWLSFLESL